jgi:hypothetical protein
MNKWDQQKLEDVVQDKHHAGGRNSPTRTDIICKFFLDAIENRKYGCARMAGTRASESMACRQGTS